MGKEIIIGGGRALYLYIIIQNGVEREGCSLSHQQGLSVTCGPSRGFLKLRVTFNELS